MRVRAECGVHVASRPTTHNTSHLFLSTEITGAKDPRRRCLRGWGAHPSASRIQHEGLDRFNVYIWLKISKPFKIKFPSCVHCEWRGTTVPPIGAWCGWQVPCAHSRMRTFAPLPRTILSQVNEPNDFHISETTDLFIQESSGDNKFLNLHDLEINDNTIGMALSLRLFTQEREDAASRWQAYHSPDERLSSSQSSVGHITVRPVSEQFDSLIPDVRENPCRNS